MIHFLAEHVSRSLRAERPPGRTPERSRTWMLVEVFGVVLAFFALALSVGGVALLSAVFLG